MRVEDTDALRAIDKPDHMEEYKESAEHDIDLSLGIDLPEKVILGEDLELQLCVACPSGCNFVDKTLRVLNADGVVISEAVLVEFDETANYTEKFKVPTPQNVGEYTWTVAFDPGEDGTVGHHEVSGTICFEVIPHPTSMSVWDVETPIIAGEEFFATIGAKCHADCTLAGCEFTVYDHTKEAVATDVLGSEPHSDLIDLYARSVKMPAPQELGTYTWDVHLARPHLDLPHTESSFSFSFTTTPAPECWLTVRVVEKESGNPIENAQIAVRPNLQTLSVNEAGEVKVALPKGQHQLNVDAGVIAPVGLPYKIGEVARVTRGFEYMIFVPEENRETFEPFQQEIEIEQDTTIVVELVGVVEPPEETTL